MDIHQVYKKITQQYQNGVNVGTSGSIILISKNNLKFEISTRAQKSKSGQVIEPVDTSDVLIINEILIGNPDVIIAT